MLYNGSTGKNTGDVNAWNGMSGNTTGTTLQFGVNGTHYVVGETYTWSIDGVEPAVANNGAVLNGTGTVTATTGNPGRNVTTVANVKVEDDLYDYVRVTIDLGSANQTYTVTGFGNTDVSVADPSYNGYFADDMNINVTATGAGGSGHTWTVNDGGSVTVKVGMEKILSNVGLGLEVVLTDGKNDYTVYNYNDNAYSAESITIDNIREDITIEVKSVKQISAPTVTCVWNDVDESGKLSVKDTVTLTFSESVTVATEPAVGGTGITATDNVDAGDTNVDSIVYTVTAVGTDDMTITINAGDVKTADGMQVVPTTFTIDDATGSVTKG